MDQNMRDDNHAPLIDIVIIQGGQPSLTLEVEDNCTLEFVRNEIEVAIHIPPQEVFFKLDGRNVGFQCYLLGNLIRKINLLTFTFSHFEWVEEEITKYYMKAFKDTYFGGIGIFNRFKGWSYYRKVCLFFVIKLSIGSDLEFQFHCL